MASGLSLLHAGRLRVRSEVGVALGDLQRERKRPPCSDLLAPCRKMSVLWQETNATPGLPFRESSLLILLIISTNRGKTSHPCCCKHEALLGVQEKEGL